MLPERLSGDECSLAAGVERLAVTAEIVLDADAAVASASFYRSRIRSDMRLDYDELDEIFAGRRPAPAAIEAPLGPRPPRRRRRSPSGGRRRRSRSARASPSSRSTPMAT